MRALVRSGNDDDEKVLLFALSPLPVGVAKSPLTSNFHYVKLGNDIVRHVTSDSSIKCTYDGWLPASLCTM